MKPSIWCFCLILEGVTAEAFRVTKTQVTVIKFYSPQIKDNDMLMFRIRTGEKNNNHRMVEQKKTEGILGNRN